MQHNGLEDGPVVGLRGGPVAYAARPHRGMDRPLGEKTRSGYSVGAASRNV